MCVIYLQLKGHGKKANLKVGQREYLSELDIAQLKDMYYCNQREAKKRGEGIHTKQWKYGLITNYIGLHFVHPEQILHNKKYYKTFWSTLENLCFQYARKYVIQNIVGKHVQKLCLQYGRQ